MEDKESGSLSQKSVLDLIVELYQGTVTGSLKLERAPLQKAVYFRDGQILFAASNDPKDQLASILVEEGKLGPDQMQVAQARVSSGNPLAKVLTELGYISQRELADAARIKVEKILTDLYSWNEGTYQFATKSLPKGAIDLDLSTTQLIFASVRRIQNRDWILAVLGSLDVVLGPSATIDGFIVESKADDAAAEVLRHADGAKSVTEIGAISSLGEFEVCKILAAGLVSGALTKSSAAAVPAVADDAFSIPSVAPAFDPGPQLSEVPFGGVETVGLETNPTPANDDPFQIPPKDDAVFQPPPQQEDEETEKTVFEAPPGIPGGLPLEPPPPPFSPPEPDEPPAMSFGAPSVAASELLIDEPEPDVGDEDSLSSARMRPKPKGRQGGGSSGNLIGILKIAGVVALAAGAAFSVYFFVWPMFAGGGDDSSAPTQSASGTTPPPAASSTAPVASGTSPSPSAPSANDPRGTGTGPGPRPAPAQPTPATTTPPAPSSTQPAPAPPPATTSTRRGPSPPPRAPAQPAPSGGSGAGGRQLLAGGDISGAASAFLRELGSSSRNKFTVAVGLYCNEENVGRVVQSARGAEQLYVLPTTVQGRQCFRVIWGTYDTRQAAEQGMGSVPNGIRAGDAAAVPVASVLR